VIEQPPVRQSNDSDINRADKCRGAWTIQDELRAAAADVQTEDARNAIRQSGSNPQHGPARLFFPADQFHFEADLALDSSEELVPVLSVADGTRRYSNLPVNRIGLNNFPPFQQRTDDAIHRVK